jgi:hypothetical protein
MVDLAKEEQDAGKAVLKLLDAKIGNYTSKSLSCILTEKANKMYCI